MILATHALVGAALGRLFPQSPWGAFFVGVASHFVLDAIPHWQYRVRSISSEPHLQERGIIFSRKLPLDIIIVMFDLACGFFLSFQFLGSGAPLSSQLPLLLGALGGAFPDGLQFLYFLLHREPLLSIQKFHIWVHSRNLDPESPVGMAAQALLILAVVLLSRAILPV